VVSKPKPPHGLVVAGSRDLTELHYHFVANAIVAWAKMFGKPTVVLHGACRGADMLAEHWCKCHDMPFERFEVSKAEWDLRGSAAGPLRNKRMIEYPHTRGLAVVRYADSKGSKDILKQATAAKLLVLDVVLPR
jgi:hypothetical protein